ncbi:hypothetical protein SAMN05443144_11055 [Fodinibius roseus]|uniref:Uncharacterized protein n=1 Tax=Fodinibius roseus TaxID=1194090 RepID=A0A1M5CQB3_9BACT|nr:hypothetical protein SAMN05443144_11055 [Fodinibius roseus]
MFKSVSAAALGVLFLTLAACKTTNSESDQRDITLDLETLETETELGEGSGKPGVLLNIQA